MSVEDFEPQYADIRQEIINILENSLETDPSLALLEQKVGQMGLEKSFAAFLADRPGCYNYQQGLNKAIQNQRQEQLDQKGWNALLNKDFDLFKSMIGKLSINDHQYYVIRLMHRSQDHRFDLIVMIDCNQILIQYFEKVWKPETPDRTKSLIMTAIKLDNLQIFFYLVNLIELKPKTRFDYILESAYCLSSEIFNYLLNQVHLNFFRVRQIVYKAIQGYFESFELGWLTYRKRCFVQHSKEEKLKISVENILKLESILDGMLSTGIINSKWLERSRKKIEDKVKLNIIMLNSEMEEYSYF